MAGIRAILAGSPFHGKGYRKIRARLAHRGLPVSGKRVLRLMRQHGLLAPRRLGPPNGDPAHAGTIITDRPDVMWGTDATRFYTEREGWCWFFGAIDHGIDELLGWHVAKLGYRWAALEPIRQGVRHAFGAFRKDVSPGASRSAATGALLEPLERLERLAALVPPPRRPLLAYHGRLAPRSRWRAAIVPKAGAEAARADAEAGVSRRWPWARLLQRVFGFEVLVCDRCGGPRRILGAVTEPHAIRRLLTALGLAANPPPGRAVPAA